MASPSILFVFPYLGTMGNLGTALEGVSRLDAPFKPGIVFSRVMQIGSAALSLMIIGALSANPILYPLSAGFLITAVTVPFVNVIIQSRGSKAVKSFFYGIDAGYDLVAKIINIITLTFGLTVFAPPAVYVPATAALAALNGAVFLGKIKNDR